MGKTGAASRNVVGLLEQHVAARLRGLRLRRGVSAPDFAQVIGVSPKTLSRIDGFRRALKLEELWKALAFLEVDCREVLPEPARPVPEVMDADYLRKVLRHIGFSFPFGVQHVVKAAAEASGKPPEGISVKVGGNRKPYPMLRAACGIIADRTPWLEVKAMSYELGYSREISLHQCMRRYRRKPKAHPVWKLIRRAEALLDKAASVDEVPKR